MKLTAQHCRRSFNSLCSYPRIVYTNFYKWFFERINLCYLLSYLPSIVDSSVDRHKFSFHEHFRPFDKLSRIFCRARWKNGFNGIVAHKIYCMYRPKARWCSITNYNRIFITFMTFEIKFQLHLSSPWRKQLSDERVANVQEFQSINWPFLYQWHLYEFYRRS